MTRRALPRRSRLSRRTTALVLLAATLFGIGVTPRSRASAESVVPGQFVAKTYTEALGRAPDQEGWRRAMAYFESSGCSPSTLRTWQSRLLVGEEYAGLGYDATARLLTVYRAALNREPDAAAVEHWRDQTARKVPWTAVLDGVYASPEFTGLARDVICNPDAPHSPNYLFGTTPPLDLGTDGPGVATESELRNTLRPNGVALPPGTTVLLARRATIALSATVDVPPGVTIATTGLPPRRAYALLGRLVRDHANHQYGAVVALEAGAALSHVWVDGHGDDPSAAPRTNPGGAVDVFLVPGAVGTRVVDSRADNASSGAFTTIAGDSSSTGPACGSAQRTLINGDLVTDYSSVHADGWWRDGISVGCENADVTDNAVIDATDVAIIVYRPVIGPQTSVVRDNVVVSAGNSAFAALAADPLSATSSSGSACDAEDFTGTVFRDNLLWTGDRTQFDFGLSIGTRGFSFLGPSWCTGRGASFVNNSTGILASRFVEAIAVSGMHDVTTAGNFDDGRTVGVRPSGVDQRCPVQASVAEVRAGHASGRLQPYADRTIEGCLGGAHRARCPRSDDQPRPGEAQASVTGCDEDRSG